MRRKATVKHSDRSGKVWGVCVKECVRERERDEDLILVKGIIKKK